MSGTEPVRIGTEKTLSAGQVRAIAALLATGNRERAARECGISKGTLYRWLAQPEFMAALRTAEAEALADVARALVTLASLAADTLRLAMEDPATPISARLRAAEAALANLLKLRELLNHEERLTELETRMKGVTDGTH